jgi:hypothetical protein
MSTELFPSGSCCTVAYLHSCYLAIDLHVTIFSPEGFFQGHITLHYVGTLGLAFKSTYSFHYISK